MRSGADDRGRPASPRARRRPPRLAQGAAERLQRLGTRGFAEGSTSTGT